MQRAIFLDRDGTLVHSEHYPSRPEQLRLYDDIALELNNLRDALGFSLVVITNQGGIARGYFSEEDLQRMHDHLRKELRDQGVSLDGIYHCPHHPKGIIPELTFACGCRKPQPGMLLRAASELDIDLHSSWFVGDVLSDIEAGNRAGCRTVLIDLGTQNSPTQPLCCPNFVARNTSNALRIIRTVERLRPELDLVYRPSQW